MNLFSLPNTEVKAIEKLQEWGILPKRRVCLNGHEMKLCVGNDVRWRCTTRSCTASVRMRVGNWLEGSRIPFVTIIRFVYCWAWELTSVNFCERELGIDKDTTCDWSNYLRCVCVTHLTSKPQSAIGGEGMVVEIDESLFTKRKSNAGRVLPPRWIFGGLCRESKECFLVEVPDRSAKTLLACIKDHIVPGSTIISDCWKGYKSAELEAAGYEHLRVNHTYNFIDPDSGAHTQHVERMWGSAKWRNKKQRGTARHLLDSYLTEFICRQEAKSEDFFEWIIKRIAEQWVPEEEVKVR